MINECGVDNGMRIGSRNWSSQKKTHPSAIFPTTNPTWADRGSNPGCYSGKPVTNNMSYGMALRKYQVDSRRVGLMTKVEVIFEVFLNLTEEDKKCLAWCPCTIINFLDIIHHPVSLFTTMFWRLDSCLHPEVYSVGPSQ
jgi:hypothetical protein